MRENELRRVVFLSGSMPIKNMTVSPRRNTYFDVFCEMFSSPEDISPTSPHYGLAGRIEDAKHIREYFEKAVSDLGLDGPHS